MLDEFALLEFILRVAGKFCFGGVDHLGVRYPIFALLCDRPFVTGGICFEKVKGTHL